MFRSTPAPSRRLVTAQVATEQSFENEFLSLAFLSRRPRGDSIDPLEVSPGDSTAPRRPRTPPKRAGPERRRNSRRPRTSPKFRRDRQRTRLLHAAHEAQASRPCDHAGPSAARASRSASSTRPCSSSRRGAWATSATTGSTPSRSRREGARVISWRTVAARPRFLFVFSSFVRRPRSQDLLGRRLRTACAKKTHRALATHLELELYTAGQPAYRPSKTVAVSQTWARVVP